MRSAGRVLGLLVATVGLLSGIVGISSNFVSVIFLVMNAFVMYSLIKNGRAFRTPYSR